MTNQKPIEPLPSRELIIDLWAKALQRESSSTSAKEVFATLLAQWGFNQHAALKEAELQKARDEELEAIIAWMMKMGFWGGVGEAIPALRAARRPKPPSLKEQALQALDCFCVNHTKATAHENIIRRALESLSDV